MNKYKDGKIYKVITNDGIYIGSTIMLLSKRLWHHRYAESSGLNIDETNSSIELIEDYPCNNKTELKQREQYWMDKIECINERRAYQSKEDRRSYKKIKSKEAYEKNKDIVKQKTQYINSWGGDKRSNNNLLETDVNIFQE